MLHAGLRTKKTREILFAAAACFWTHAVALRLSPAECLVINNKFCLILTVNLSERFLLCCILRMCAMVEGRLKLCVFKISE